MEAETKQLTLYQKLLEIQSKVNGLSKDKKTYNYTYVTGDKLLYFVRPLMNELGLLLKQEVLSIENTRQDYAVKNGLKSEILSNVMMRFTWIDTATGEKDENLFGANGQNDWEKGLGSALTYAERYFILKYFHIPTDEDDIDNDQRTTAAPVAQQPTQQQPAQPAQQPTPPPVAKMQFIRTDTDLVNTCIDYLHGTNLSGQNPQCQKWLLRDFERCMNITSEDFNWLLNKANL